MRVLLVVMLVGVVARGEEPTAASPASAPAISTTTANPTTASLVPPVPISLPKITWPEGATSDAAVQVKVQLHIGVDGAVSEVTLISGAGEPFDSAVIDGARGFQFQPALSEGKPIEVIVPFTQNFVPPPRTQPGADDDATRTALLTGLVTERGTRKAAAEATVIARSGERSYNVATDADGAFRLPLQPGEWEVRIESNAHRAFLRRETLKEGEHLQLKYLVERDSYSPYEAVVEGERERTEVSRTTLRGREITQIPGTFGDPYRVIGVLPGVSQAMSLLPLPIVRGSSPGDTGLLLDGERLPLLFHLFDGPSVIHPELIDRVDFYPGGFPVEYGGYVGGIVDGVTRRTRPNEDKLDLDLSLLQTGVFARHDFESIGTAVTAAGRIGYPGTLLSLANLPIDLSYWDYQARADGTASGGGWTTFFYGARDALSMKDATGAFQPLLRFEFHRADLRYAQGDEENGAGVRLVGGYDESLAGGASDTTAWVLHPRVNVQHRLLPDLSLRAGAEWTLREEHTAVPASSTTGATTASRTGAAQTILSDTGPVNIGGLWSEARWRVTDALMLVPGVRGDSYHHRGVQKFDVDPRLMARWRVSDETFGGTTLKGALGVFHQPPRFFIPIPGVEESALDLGLLRSIQSSLGAEVRLGTGLDVDVQAYYNDNDPVLFDLKVNPTSVNIPPPTTLPGELPSASADSPSSAALKNLYAAQLGRAYGLEILLRKRDSQHLFGWLAYTLSHSERRGSDGSWSPFDFDRQHIVNLVLGTRLPRNWEIGGRLLFQTGTPLTTIHGYNDARTEPTFRFDLRIDKRAVLDKWILDFYIDVINTTLAAETGGLVGSSPIYFVLPTVGFRAVL